MASQDLGSVPFPLISILHLAMEKILCLLTLTKSVHIRKCVRQKNSPLAKKVIERTATVSKALIFKSLITACFPFTYLILSRDAADCCRIYSFLILQNYEQLWTATCTENKVSSCFDINFPPCYVWAIDNCFGQCLERHNFNNFIVFFWI